MNKKPLTVEEVEVAAEQFFPLFDVVRNQMPVEATIEDKEIGIDGHSKKWQKVRDGLDYFREHNAEAYMVLLD